MGSMSRVRDVAGDPFAGIGCTEAVPIGSGGTSIVYRARQVAFDRLIALKVLTAPLGDERARRRFSRELTLATRLTGHPNVVTVFGSGFLPDGRGYVEMEYCSGGSLADLLVRRGPLAVRDVVSIGVKLTGVLELARREGIVHRDVKPANVLITRFGEPALSDFGIATVSGENTGTTQGLTPVHAAPEVLESRTVGPAADQWSLASTLHTLLAGRAPFAEQANEGMLAGMLRVLSQPVPVIPRSDVSPELRAVLERAMAKQPEGRFATPLDFGHALQDVERGYGWPATALPIEEVDEARFGWVPPRGEPAGGAEVPHAAPIPAGPAPILEPPGGWTWAPLEGLDEVLPAPAETTEQWSRRGGRPVPPVPPPSPGPPPSVTPSYGWTAPSAPPDTTPWGGSSPAPAAPSAVPLGVNPVRRGTTFGVPLDEVATSSVSAAASAVPPGPGTGETTQVFSRRPEAEAAAPVGVPSQSRWDRRTVYLVGGAALAVLVVVAVVAVLLVSGSGSNHNSTSSSPTFVAGQASSPQNVEVADDYGTTVTLEWTDPNRGKFPYVVAVDPGKVQAATSYTGTTVTGLSAAEGYCFKVGAVYAQNPVQVAYADPVCVRKGTLGSSGTG